MIQAGTKLKVADNSGAKLVKCIKVLRRGRSNYASLGDVIIVSVKEAEPRSAIKEGQIVKGVIARIKKSFRRSDGSYIRFDDNAVVLLNQAGEIRGTRIFGPVAKELREEYMKIVSLAPEVL